MNRIRVLIVNQHTQNFGDDAAGIGLVELLLRTGRIESIDVVYNGLTQLPISDSRVVKARGVELQDIGRSNLLLYFGLGAGGGVGNGGRALRKLRMLVRRSDIVVVAPSGANIGIYRDWAFLVRLMIVVREGARPVFHYNTVGPSGSRVFDAFALRVLRKSTIYVREQASQDFLNSRFIHSVVGPDTAFVLDPIMGSIRRNVISLVPSELDSWHPEFQSKGANELVLGPLATELARFARMNGLVIEILPHLKSEGERRFNSQVREALERAGMPHQAVIMRDSIVSVYDYDEALASSRLVVGGRYHSVVLAAKNFRPFVALSYENKMAEVARYLGMADFSVDLHIASEAPGKLREALSRSLTEEMELSAQLKRVIRDQLVPAVGQPLRDLGLM